MRRALAVLILAALALHAQTVPAPEPAAADLESFCPGIGADIAADSGARRPALTPDEFDVLIAVVRAEHYPELAGFDVRSHSFTSPSDYLHANVDPETAWKDARGRSYRVMVNPALLASPPSARALRSILTHELSHVRDYTRMSSVRLADFAVTYALGPIRDYERRTDETALEKGEGCGLIEYRLWLYARESGTALAAKKRDYDTPAEILAWLKARAGTKP